MNIPDYKILQNTPVIFNVKDFGAKGDSSAVETEAINKAIDAAMAAGEGKGLEGQQKIKSFRMQ